MSSKSLPSQLTSYDLFKALAVVLMIVDHVGTYFLVDEQFLRAIGRVCVPIWMFLIGYARNRSIPVELWGGGLILVVSQFVVGQPIFPFNILMTVVFVRLTLNPLMSMIDRHGDWFLYLVLAGLFILAVPTYPFLEYGSTAYLMVLFGLYIRRADMDRARIVMWVSIVSYILYQQLYFGFDENSLIFMSAGTVGMHLILQRFSSAQYPQLTKALPSVFVLLIQLCGRQTLMIYVVHLLMFKAVVLMLGYDGYSLFDLQIFHPALTPFVGE